MNQSMKEQREALKRAGEAAHATEWCGDPRVNMTTAIKAARVLSKRIDELEKIALLYGDHRGDCSLRSYPPLECDCGWGEARDSMKTETGIESDNG